jgi:hypothetical protein
MITTLNSPSVRRLNGKDITERIGFSNLNPIVRRIPPTISV